MAMGTSLSIAASCLVVIGALLVVPCISAAAEAVHAEGADSTSCQSTACTAGKRSDGRSSQSRLSIAARGAEEDAAAEDTLALEMHVELLQLDLLPHEPERGSHSSTLSSSSVDNAGSQSSLAALQTGENVHFSVVKQSLAKLASASEAKAPPFQPGFDISRWDGPENKSGVATGFDHSGSDVAGDVVHRLNTTAAQALIQQTLLQTLSGNKAVDGLLTGVRQRMVKVSSEIKDTDNGAVQDRLGSFEATVTAALDGSLDDYEHAAEGLGNVTESLADLLVAAQHEAAAASLAVAVNKSFVILDEALDSIERSRFQLRGLSKRPPRAAQKHLVVMDQLLTNGTHRMASFGEKLDGTFNRTFGYLELLAGLQGTGTFDPLRLKVKHMAEAFTSSFLELHSGIIVAQNQSRVMESKADYRTVISFTMSLVLLLHSFPE